MKKRLPFFLLLVAVILALAYPSVQLVNDPKK